MIKKIIRYALCLLAVFGFSLVTFTTALNFPETLFFNALTAAGLGLAPVGSDSAGTEAPLQTAPPYTYINLPKYNSPPAAIEYYDLFPFEDVIQQGQDPRPPKEPPADDTVTLPENTFPVIALDMSENQSANNLLYKNESNYSPDINLLSHAQYPLSYTKTVSNNGEFEPVVLIIHTHGTECYLPDGETTYTADTPTRSTDTELNVVAAGRVLAEELNKKGVPTLHCETMFDKDSYSESYDLSEKAVLEYLAAYPSIQYVFDVHRDSIVRGNNEKIKPLVTVNGADTAQAMFVVGTNSSGADHPDWMNNLTVASVFQYKLIEKYGSLLRPINLRAASFNAEHTPGSLLIEIGTCGNTVTEAKNCASLLGQTIADIILTDGIG